MNNKTKNIMLSLLVMLLWGSLFPTVKMGFKAFDIESTGDLLLFAGIRFAICGLCITVYCIFRNKKDFKPVKNAIIPILLSGLFAIVLHYGFTYMGLKLTDSSKTAILKQVGVLLYVCFSAVFFKDDKLTANKLAGVILGFLGIIILNTDSLGINLKTGDIFIIIASFCTVFSNVISKNIFQKTDPIVSTGLSQLFGGIVLVAAGLLSGGNMSFKFTKDEFILVYIIIASIFSYCIWFCVVKKGELSKLFIIKFAEPVFAAVFGAFLLKENIFNAQYLFSFILISLGILISNVSVKKHSKI